jgi:hypothetical protein
MPKTEFIWTDELVQEFAKKYYLDDWATPHAIEQFKNKKSKEIKEKERIEAELFVDACGTDSMLVKLKNKDHFIPKEKRDQLQAAIESVLNDEQPKEDYSFNQNYETISFAPQSGEFVTLEKAKEMVDTAKKKAWSAARRVVSVADNHIHFLYKNIHEYDQQKNNPF